MTEDQKTVNLLIASLTIANEDNRVELLSLKTNTDTLNQPSRHGGVEQKVIGNYITVKYYVKVPV